MANEPKMVEVPEIAAAKINFLNSYSIMESSLAILLAILLDVPPKKAIAIFWRMTNTRSRYALIEDLLKQGPLSEYGKFWSGLEEMISQVDNTRNNAVHWIQVAYDGITGGNAEELHIPDYSLMPMAALTGSKKSKLGTEDLNSARIRCEHVGFIIRIFSEFLQDVNRDNRQSMRKIFQTKANNETLEELAAVIFA